MRIGDKCVFTVGKDMFGGKLKANHKYIGKCAGDMIVSYRNCIINVKSIKKIEKTVVKKEKAPTASDYKNFADTAFETAVRFRDKFTSVISGRKFPEGTWNELQAGHGITRQHWATRHNPSNCHAITSGENFHMSIGTTTIIAKYWSYVVKKYGQHTVDNLINGDHPTPKLSISYLKEDCLWCYDFLKSCTKGNAKTPAEIIRWRIESYPKTKAKSVLKILEKIEKGDL